MSKKRLPRNRPCATPVYRRGPRRFPRRQQLCTETVVSQWYAYRRKKIPTFQRDAGKKPDILRLFAQPAVTSPGRRDFYLPGTPRASISYITKGGECNACLRPPTVKIYFNLFCSLEIPLSPSGGSIFVFSQSKSQQSTAWGTQWPPKCLFLNCPGICRK